MVEVQMDLTGCTNCGHMEARAYDRPSKRPVCDHCLVGTMRPIVARTGPMSGDVTKFFRIDA